jgi:hypothetical protein
MEARTLLMVAAGFLIGSYFFNQRRKQAEAVGKPSITPMAQPVSQKDAQALADEAKLEICKDNWVRFSQTRRFASAEAMQNTYDNFMATCVSQA